MPMKLRQCIAELIIVLSLAFPCRAFRAEEVSFVNNEAGGLRFSGEIIMPEADALPKALLVLASGSGSQDRDESYLGHKPFKAIAEALGGYGYAVLRFDDRGVGGSDRGPDDVTTDDFAGDVASALALVRKRFPDVPAGVLGHSEGGTIAYKLAAAGCCDFIITMGAPAYPGDSINYDQLRAAFGAAAEGDPKLAKALDSARRRYAMVRSGMPSYILEMQIYADVLSENPGIAAVPALAERTRREVKVMASPWFRNFITYDPTADICAVEVPWLALNGELDHQVLPRNLSRIAELNPAADTRLLPSLNHMMLDCKSGAIDEYHLLQGDISPAAIDAIVGWLENLFGKNVGVEPFRQSR